MPVPVPRISKQPAHPVIKTHNDEDGHANPFQYLTGSLPAGPREQWIDSLPTWRRTKLLRTWEADIRRLNQQDFQQGLTVADNAAVIKGSRAQACAPPLPSNVVGKPADAPTNHVMQLAHRGDSAVGYIAAISTTASMTTSDKCDRGAFSPILDDQSPCPRSRLPGISSPAEPVTPFGDFVDRAIAAAPGFVSTSTCHPATYNFEQGSDRCDNSALNTSSVYQPVELPKEPQPAPAPPPEVVTPSATAGYKKLAEPLSEWVANYVWKVCTGSVQLPTAFTRQILRVTKQHSAAPPAHLATAVHSLLLSTLLQPSAVLLALLYIAKLPVEFGCIALCPEHASFRAVLFGDEVSVGEEVNAPFRIIVLGCMLANKWLDDHTFSNKTWHTISNIPVQALNKLESLALDIFAYDLSVPSSHWAQWLSYLMSYHASLSSPSHPQPISRPSANPHSIVRKTIEDIMRAPAACNSGIAHPHPVFLGLEERRKERMEKEQALAVDVLEIDLDEDGPLREEYLPKRRIGGTTSIRSSHTNQSIDENWERQKMEMEKALPPPAKWSPAGDEPILRDRNRSSGHYIAVAAAPMNPSVPFQLMQYIPSHESAYSNHWAGGHGFMAVSQAAMGYVLDVPALPLPTQQSYDPVTQGHSRSQSLSHDQDIIQCNHTRSYSQSRFDHTCNDIRLIANDYVPMDVDMSWTAGHYTYPAPMFAPYSTTNYQQSAWLRT